MFSEQSIIDLLVPLGYTIKEFPDKQFDIYAEDDIELPIIFVGYGTIDSEYPGAPISYNYLDLHGENLTQSFDIHLVCTKASLPVLFKDVHTALVGKYPVGFTSDPTTSITFAQGGLIGKNNGNIHWLNRYRIGFPTINTLI